MNGEPDTGAVPVGSTLVRLTDDVCYPWHPGGGLVIPRGTVMAVVFRTRHQVRCLTGKSAYGFVWVDRSDVEDWGHDHARH